MSCAARVPRPHRAAREPRLRPRSRAVVRHGRPVVEARRVARSAGRAARARRRRQAAHQSALHAHIGTGPQVREFDENMRKLVDVSRRPAAALPRRRGRQPGRRHPAPVPPRRARVRPGPLYRPRPRGRGRASGRRSPGPAHPRRDRAGALTSSPPPACSSARVKDIKETTANAKGPGHRFLMVDAGFGDLVRPAMYGSYHHISIVGKGAGRAPEPFVVAGPLCGRRRLHARRPRAARPAPARRAPTAAISSCSTTRAPTAPP